MATTCSGIKNSSGTVLSNAFTPATHNHTSDSWFTTALAGKAASSHTHAASAISTMGVDGLNALSDRLKYIAPLYPMGSTVYLNQLFSDDYGIGADCMEARVLVVSSSGKTIAQTFLLPESSSETISFEDGISSMVVPSNGLWCYVFHMNSRYYVALDQNVYDSEPTLNSHKLVKSGAIKTALNTITGTIGEKVGFVVGSTDIDERINLDDYIANRCCIIFFNNNTNNTITVQDIIDGDEGYIDANVHDIAEVTNATGSIQVEAGKNLIALAVHADASHQCGECWAFTVLGVVGFLV